MKYRIAPSILAADFARLGEEVRLVTEAGADLMHLDIMDNHYVPNLSFGPMIGEALRGFGIDIPLDMHLMAKPVGPLIQACIEAGASSISIHPEASEHLDRDLRSIREGGCQAGVALNPATSLSAIEHVLDNLDFILIMSVNPGFGGQSFIPHSLRKITAARAQTDPAKISIQVDGGICSENIAAAAAAGADTFIAGSAIFGKPDYGAAIADLRQALESGSKAQ